MGTKCKYMNGRVVHINFYTLNENIEIDTKEKYNLILIERGKLSLNINGKKYSFIAPCIVSLKENLIITDISAETLSAKNISFNVSFLNIGITFDLINSREYEICMERFGFIPLNIFYEENEYFHKNLPLSRDNLIQIRSLYNKINKSITEQIDIRWSCRTRLYLNTILELLYEVYVELLNKNNVDIKSPNSWVTLLLDKIHTDYSKNISLNNLSEYVNINKTTVSKYFKQITGFSVTDYIINYRIKCASHTLATTEITLSEIAQEYGFSSEAYFIRQFKNKMKMTPSEYRIFICNRRKKELNHK